MFFLFLIILLLLIIVNVGLGAVEISPWRVIQALLGFGDADERYIILHYRMPRIVLGIMVGASLAVSGTIVQSVLNNPLAAPETIGISGGASVAAIGATILVPSLSYQWMGLSAFAGGLLAAAFVYLISYRKGTDPLRLALVGVAVSGFCGAGVQIALLQLGTNVQTALLWLNGSLYSRTWEHVLFIIPIAVPLLLIVWYLSKNLDIFQLGQVPAAGLGIAVERMRITLLGTAVLLAASSVTVAGLVSFIGLIAPHMARKLFGLQHQYLIPSSALLGACILVAADGIGRGLLPPIEIPAGIVTTFIGAPYFLYLLWKQARVQK